VISHAVQSPIHKHTWMSVPSCPRAPQSAALDVCISCSHPKHKHTWTSVPSRPRAPQSAALDVCISCSHPIQYTSTPGCPFPAVHAHHKALRWVCILCISCSHPKHKHTWTSAPSCPRAPQSAAPISGRPHVCVRE